MKQYACTSAPLYERGYDEQYQTEYREPASPAPEPPEGPGWKYLDSAVHGDRVLWFWERAVREPGNRGK